MPRRPHHAASKSLRPQPPFRTLQVGFAFENEVPECAFGEGVDSGRLGDSQIGPFRQRGRRDFLKTRFALRLAIGRSAARVLTGFGRRQLFSGTGRREGRGGLCRNCESGRLMLNLPLAQSGGRHRDRGCSRTFRSNALRTRHQKISGSNESSSLRGHGLLSGRDAIKRRDRDYCGVAVSIALIYRHGLSLEYSKISATGLYRLGPQIE